MVSPSQIHQSILLELCPLLNSYVKSQNGNCKVFLHHQYKTFQSPPLTIVLPDIMIICNKEKLDKNQCNDAPDFIIEIVTLVNPSDDCIRKENLFISFLEIANSLNI